MQAEVLRCEEGRLWLALPGRSGEFAVPLDDVLWTAFPTPPGLEAVEAGAHRGEAAARQRLRELFEAWRPFVAVPGSYGPRLGLAVADYLVDEEKEVAETIFEELADGAWDLRIRAAAALRCARLRVAAGRPTDAVRICRSLIETSLAARHEAEAWIVLGRAYEDTGDLEAGFEAYLHPIALYARDPALLREALAGAERCARSLGRVEEAAIYAEELRGLEEAPGDSTPVPDDDAGAAAASQEGDRIP
jgi:tetratricopeptide (TPR) repeat protein